MQCHGVKAVAGGAAPDLRTSPIPQTPETFNSIVREGALLPNGMPQFKMVTPEDSEDLRQYIRARAADWRKEVQKSPVGKTN
jgi:quinohemoprotein ethanol dehydrogenase